MNFWIKTNYFLKKIFPNYVWNIPNNEKKVYLTFDDGPTPEITTWTLEQLKKYNAKATFFCIGNNIQKHPEIFKRILTEGHSVGNHTFNHLKGWETPTESYLKNVALCQSEIANHNLHGATLFRPPYGKIKTSQSKALRKLGCKIIMWDIISEDYDQRVSPEKCFKNVTQNIETGSIVVFHDSKKAFQNLEFTLPKTLEFLSKNGFVCEKLD
jgi:peptidoglycan/xylan/chitin deacetylase (PgdA/CDA1 family)